VNQPVRGCVVRNKRSQNVGVHKENLPGVKITSRNRGMERKGEFVPLPEKRVIERSTDKSHRRVVSMVNVKKRSLPHADSGNWRLTRQWGCQGKLGSARGN